MTSPLLAWLALSILAADGPPVARGEATFRPTAAESSVPELFRLPAATFTFEIEPAADSALVAVDRVRFPSPLVSPDPANNTVHGEYFRPRPGVGRGRRPAAVMLHILGADFALSRYYAARLSERGVGVLFIQMPYYGDRRPPGQAEKRFLSGDVDRSTFAMRQGVCDVRRAAAWLACRPEIDPDRVGVTGISLGGITSALATAVDPSIRKSAWLLAGGGLDRILWTMDEPGADRWRKAWLDAGRTPEDLARLTRPFDPLTYADGFRGKSIRMVAGKTDEVVPPSAARALWEAAGRPPIRWCDCGHYSSAGYLLPAIREAAEFFAAD